MSPAFVAGGIVFARVRFLATKRYSRGFAVRREREIVSFTFAARLYSSSSETFLSEQFRALLELKCLLLFLCISGGDGGWKECAWSETLGQCFSPSYLPIVCLAGQCGRVIRGSTSDCMGSCGVHQQCSYCLNSYNCGWCAEQGIAGIGQCFKGGIQGQENLFVETLFTIRWFVPEKFNRPFIPLSSNFQLACQVGYFGNEIGFFREFSPRTYQLAISEFPRASVSKRG